jgi:hypothetical protein
MYLVQQKRLHAEFSEPVRDLLKSQSNGFKPLDNAKRSIIVIFDHYDDIDLLKGAEMGPQALSELGKGYNLHFVIGGSLDIMRDSSDKLRRRAESSRYTLVLQDYEAVRYMCVRANLAVNQALPPGRRFLVKAVSASMTQICQPSLNGADGAAPEEDLIASINKKYRKKAEWSFQGTNLAVLEAAISADSDGIEQPMNITVQASTAAEASTAMGDLEKLLSKQAALIETKIPKERKFTKVKVPKAKGKSASKKKAKAKK